MLNIPNAAATLSSGCNADTPGERCAASSPGLVAHAAKRRKKRHLPRRADYNHPPLSAEQLAEGTAGSDAKTTELDAIGRAAWPIVLTAGGLNVAVALIMRSRLRSARREARGWKAGAGAGEPILQVDAGGLPQPPVLADEIAPFLDRWHVEYIDADGVITERTIRVLRVLPRLGQVEAWCEIMNAHRTFRIDRFSRVNDPATGQAIDLGKWLAVYAREYRTQA